MIKYFRNIRRKLLKGSGISSYMIYAIGEILLVVVGILIALWINNLNQQKKNLRLEQVYIEEFLLDLQEDVHNLEGRIKTNKKRIAQVDTISYILGTNKSLTKTERLQFAQRHILLLSESYFIPEKTTIRQLESSSHGALMRNKELRNKLFRYYNANDRNEQNNEVSIQLYMHNFNAPNLLNVYMLNDVLKALTNLDIDIQTVDLGTLVKNDGYIQALFLRRENAETQNRGYERMKKLAEELIEMIEEG